MSNYEQSATSEEQLETDLRKLDWLSPIRSSAVVLGAGLLAVPFVLSSTYTGYVAALVLMFAIMASGYNVMLGWPNLLVFCPAALAVVGGVVSSLLAIEMGLPFILTILIGGVVAALVGGAVSAAAIVIGSNFEIIIATLAFEFVVFYALSSWELVGPTGISGMPDPSLGALVFTSQMEVYVFLLVALTGVTFLVAAFDSSLSGTLSIATGEDEELLRAIGYNPATYKLISVVLGAFILGIGGAIYAHVNGLITPGAFTLDRTVLLLVITVLGGLRTIYGPVVGAVVMLGLPEIVRTLGFGDYRAYIIGVTLIIVVLYFPKGIVGQWKEYASGSSEGVREWLSSN